MPALRGSGRQEKRLRCGLNGAGRRASAGLTAAGLSGMFHSLGALPTWPGGAGTLWCYDPNRRCIHRRSNCSPEITEQRGHADGTGTVGTRGSREESLLST